MDETIDFAAGALSGVAVVYVGQPFDTIKVKMQTYPKLYTNMFDCFRNVIRNEGLLTGLYAGTVPALAANIAENSVLFAGYGACQKIYSAILLKEEDEIDPLGKAFAGSMASFFSSFALCPTELVKCKLQAMQETNGSTVVRKIGPMQLTRQIVKTDGLPGLFRGLTSTIAREMPGYFFFFGGYEVTRLMLADSEDSKDVGFFRTMIAGAVGGVCFWTVIFPADVVKSRIQIQSGVAHSLGSELMNIFKKEGVGALYNGLAVTLVRTIPATAALFLTYEYCKVFFQYMANRGR